jgi:hypothetical protein
MTTTLISKYRGTKEFLPVYCLLISAARSRDTVTYQQVAQIMGLLPQGHHMGAETGHLLGEISEDECRHGRPMLSALAVSVLGMPGEGFFKLATQLGRFDPSSGPTQRGFWEKERDAVYEAWK